jgi:hypothetical protein
MSHNVPYNLRYLVCYRDVVRGGSPVPPTTLYRLAGLAGMLSGLLLLFNTARRGGVVAANQLTHGIAPLSSVLGLFALTGLYLWQRDQTGLLGLVGYALNLAGLAGTVGVEYVTNYVFPHLDDALVESLVDGPTGTTLLLTAVVFLLGVLAFGVATWRARLLPAPAILLYVVGLVPVALRGVLPEPAVAVGLILAAAGTAWLSAALWRTASRDANAPATPRSAGA